MIRLMFAPYKVSAEMKKYINVHRLIRPCEMHADNEVALLRIEGRTDGILSILNVENTVLMSWMEMALKQHHPNVFCLLFDCTNEKKTSEGLFTHSFGIPLFFSSRSLRAIVNFTFSTHLFSGRLLFLSGGRILYDFICIWMRLCRWY